MGWGYALGDAGGADPDDTVAGDRAAARGAEAARHVTGMDTLSAAFSAPGVLVELLHDPLEVDKFEVTQLLPQLLAHSLPYLHRDHA